ncbi:MAG: class I SAM-dependent methyltransferase [Gammaproteobacteria bacterium]|nr:class I SAM-dependent methyltransferase [Gammaproteobacteria bacterium]
MNKGVEGGVNLVPGSVQETMVMCFLDRACYSPLFPSLLEDRLAVGIYSQFQKQLTKRHFRQSEMPALSILLRARNFDNAVKNYTLAHPDATVVNLAAGLETNFSRVDNGRLTWFDVDLPDAIDFRRQFIPETARSHTVKGDILDHAWMDRIEFDPVKGLILVASGIFCYFTEQQLLELLSAMAEKFPGAQIIFESYSPPVILGNNLFFALKGIDARLVFGSFNMAQRLRQRNLKFKLIDQYAYYSRYPKEMKVRRDTRFFMWFSNCFKLMEFVHIEFPK